MPSTVENVGLFAVIRDTYFYFSVNSLTPGLAEDKDLY